MYLYTKYEVNPTNGLGGVKTYILVTLTFVVTLTLGSRSRIIVFMLARYEMHLSTKYDVHPTNGLRVVLQNMYKTCILVMLTFVVTLTLGSRSRNIVYLLSGYEMHLSTKYEVNRINGLGGVR